MLLNGDLKCFYHLLGGVEVGMPEDIQQPVIAKLVLLRIFGFVKSVGIDEEGTLPDALKFFTLIFESGPEADGGIGQYFEEITMMLTSADDGGIMSGIAIVKVCTTLKKVEWFLP